MSPKYEYQVVRGDTYNELVKELNRLGQYGYRLTSHEISGGGPTHGIHLQQLSALMERVTENPGP